MAICSAQAALGIIKSLFAPNHGPLSFCPLYMFFVAFFLALHERSGRRQPPAERSPCSILQIPTAQLAKMSIDPKLVELTAGVLKLFFYSRFIISCHPCSSTHKVRESASQVFFSRMQLTPHATRRTPHGASHLVQTMSAWSVNPQSASSWHCRDAGVCGIKITAMHENECNPPLPPASSFPLPAPRPLPRAFIFCALRFPCAVS